MHLPGITSANIRSDCARTNNAKTVVTGSTVNKRLGLGAREVLHVLLATLTADARLSFPVL